MSSEKDLKEWAARSSKTLRKTALSHPPEVADRDVREGVAASAELGILILQKLGEIHLMQVELRTMFKTMNENDPLRELFIEGHRSQLELNEEVTRADLNMKTLRFQRSEKLLMRIVVAFTTPVAVFKFWEWLQMLVN